ncbi:alpha- and gamma-adaptin-binding protein p34-like [Paramacrobiotus metropolitanus]|uniref:alpha- and gamma-adaptin-binding protein p34-like n=1 Tax=Paramacrobiotus metropolitanus TaxID=2943436 RepID=UPI00244606BA|nr:alpha- and gamma-adaptin-binding protein p34-like [Paramacrobiotus metropolitanus]
MTESSDSNLVSVPSILAVSCSESKSSKDLIADLLQGVCSPAPDYMEENIDGYKWDMNTKYYTATVKVCAPKYRTVPSAEFAESVEAVMLYFRPQSRDEFVVVQSWLRTIDQLYAPTVKLLICEFSVDGDEVPRQELMNFCIDRQLELVELAPVEIDSEEEEFGGASHGFARIRSALYAHMWSNLTMKAETPRNLRTALDAAASHHQEETERSSANVLEATAVEGNQEEMGLEEREVDMFEQLFSRLHQFKSTAETLSNEERRSYAEQITKQFWKSMGDDSEEDSLSD